MQIQHQPLNNPQEFFEWLVNAGLISGPASWYTSGKAKPEEYTHALKVGWAAAQTKDPYTMKTFWEGMVSIGAISGPASWYTSGNAKPEEFTHAFTVATNWFSSQGNAGGGVTTGPGTPPGENKDKEGVGDQSEDGLTILTSNKMKWYYDSGAGKWYVSYGLPNSNKEIIFEAAPDQMDKLFGVGMRPVSFETIGAKTLFAQEHIHFSGNISEMQGKGSFESEYDKVLAVAKNNGQLPSWMANDAKALDLIYIAQADNKSNEWLLDQFSKLDSFKARFPNLAKIQSTGNLTLGQAIAGFLEYEAGVSQAINALGLTGSQLTPDIVGGLIDRGWSLQDTLHALQNFKRQQDFAPALDAFNQILAANGMDPLSTQQQLFDFMEGKAPSAYYDLYEASSIQEAATQAGLGGVWSAQDSINAALAGEFSRDSATQAMQKAAQLLLRMRTEVDSNRFGLSQDELLDVALGMAPRSGRTETEIFEAVNRATLSAQANLRDRVKPFHGFTQRGVVGSQSLGALRDQT